MSGRLTGGQDGGFGAMGVVAKTQRMRRSGRPTALFADKMNGPMADFS
jgi:hypothetical protein